MKRIEEGGKGTVSSFAEDAEKQNRAGYAGRGCGVSAMLARLDSDLASEVAHVIMDRPDISATSIHRALKERGLTGIPSAYTIQRHRREVCNCEA